MVQRSVVDGDVEIALYSAKRLYQGTKWGALFATPHREIEVEQTGNFAGESLNLGGTDGLRRLCADLRYQVQGQSTEPDLHVVREDRCPGFFRLLFSSEA